MHSRVPISAADVAKLLEAMGGWMKQETTKTRRLEADDAPKEESHRKHAWIAEASRALAML